MPTTQPMEPSTERSLPSSSRTSARPSSSSRSSPDAGSTGGSDGRRATLSQVVGKYTFASAVAVLALMVVLTALGLIPGPGARRPDDGRYDPLAAPEKLGGFPRWHGMVEGELADAKQFGRQYHARAIEATYLPPGLDPILVTAVRAPDRLRDGTGAPYGRNGRVLCSSAGVFVECYRTGPRLTVDVLAPKAMPQPQVAELVEAFWRAQLHVPAA
jgi:hypothetical protein